MCDGLRKKPLPLDVFLAFGFHIVKGDRKADVARTNAECGFVYRKQDVISIFSNGKPGIDVSDKNLRLENFRADFPSIGGRAENDLHVSLASPGEGVVVEVDVDFP